MGWIRCVCWEKLQCDFSAQTFALIAPVRTDLKRVSYGNKTVPNAPKEYETHQNMNLGSNGVDRGHSLRKISTRLRGTNFYISCTSSDRFETSFVRQQNGPKCTQRVQNAPKHEFRVCFIHSGCVLDYLITPRNSVQNGPN